MAKDDTKDAPAEVHPMVGQPVPLALRGAGAETVEFPEHEGVVFVVEDDTITGVREAEPEAAPEA